jgi:hypothetical protein
MLAIATVAQQSTPAESSSSTQSQAQAPASGQATPPSQQPADKPAAKPADKGDQPANEQGKVTGTSNDRLFYALPNFLSLQNGAKLPPLSAKDKFKVVALGTFDYMQYPWWGLLASISQAENNEPGFGQGWLGYAKRYGATAADSTIENFMTAAVFPSVLHQDPRFYYSSKGGAFRRTGYAVSRIFVTRSDSGHTQFNFSEIFGAATSAAISTYSYHPKSTIISTPTNPHMFVGSDRTLVNTVDVYGTQLTIDTVTIVVKEFWPDIHRMMSHKHKGDASAASPKP